MAITSMHAKFGETLGLRILESITIYISEPTSYYSQMYLNLLGAFVWIIMD